MGGIVNLLQDVGRYVACERQVVAVISMSNYMG